MQTEVKITYAKEGASVLDAVSEYETRTLGRLDSRERAGRKLSEVDIQRWQHIQDVANRVLGRVASGDDSRRDAERVYAEYELLKARISGVSV